MEALERRTLLSAGLPRNDELNARATERLAALGVDIVGTELDTTILSTGRIHASASVGFDPPRELADRVSAQLWTVAEQTRRVVAMPGLEPSARRQAFEAFELVRAGLARIDDRGAIQVYVYLDPNVKGAREQLAAAGVVEEAYSRRGGIVQTWLLPEQIAEVASIAGIRLVTLPGYGFSHTGWTNTAGDAIHRADQVRSRLASLGINGSGVKVGVISTGMPNAWRVQTTGDLPSVIIQDPYRPGLSASSPLPYRDEGTALLEIVHDIAPGAQLYFSGPVDGSEGLSSVRMEESIDWMIAQGVDVIVDDLGLLDQPFFQHGPVARAVDDAYRAGIVYVAAAGNLAQVHYQGRYDPVNYVPLDKKHDFGGIDAYMAITVPANATIVAVLQWSDPWWGSYNDYNMALYSAPINSSTYLLNGSAFIQNGDDLPFELVPWTNPFNFSVTVYLTVNLYSAYNLGSVRELELFVRGASSIEHNVTRDSIFGHPAADGAIAVGAVSATIPGASSLQPYSSRGPSSLYTEFGWDQSPVRVNTLAGVAVDDVETRIGQLGYFDPDGTGRFTGTSAAAPHVAGIAALLLQARPWLTPAEVRSALNGTAIDIGASGYDRDTGHGRFDALNAVYSVLTPAPPDLAASSDSGWSNTDDYTNVTTPTFTGTAPADSLVLIYADGLQVGSQQLSGGATTYSITTTALTPGTRAITVRYAPDTANAVRGLSRASSTLMVTIDTTSPVADILDISPDPRATAITTATISFSEPISGFVRGDLRLFRNGGTSLLSSSQSLTSADGGATWTLGNLDALTAPEGSYELRLNDGGTLITDRAGNPLPAGTVNDLWQVIVHLTVTTANDSGPGSLRQAILDANAIAGPNVIRFAIGSGLKTIAPASMLPAITDPVTIDGTTQPGYTGTPIIELDGSSAGDADGLLVSPGGSVIRGLVVNRFAYSGIALYPGGGNLIENCYIGTDATGTLDRGNRRSGIYIAGGSSGNTIGGTAPGAGNLISGNDRSGIGIYQAGTAGNRIVGNRIGTNAEGTAAIGNSHRGIEMAGGTTANTIGGTIAGAGNLISGNSWEGIALFDTGTSNHLFQGNRIGTNAEGTTAIPNSSGVWLSRGTSANTIGGATAGASNLISGNTNVGILIHDSDDNTVLGNRIGTDADGLAAIPNNVIGLRLNQGASGNTIGGGAAGEGNLISGNGNTGLDLFDAGTSYNRIQGNLIGTDATGTGRLGNAVWGVYLAAGASDNTIGGLTPGLGNVVSASGDGGIGLRDAATVRNVIAGNAIGTDAARILDLGNTSVGIFLENASDNLIYAENAIRHNRMAGIALVGAAVGNAIYGNSVDSNGGLGIDLGFNGVTPNDAGDADTGPNRLQNFPVLTSASAGATTRVVGSLSAAASTLYRIDFYASPTADPSGHGEGGRYLGNIVASTNASGQLSFNASLDAETATGEVVSSTATRVDTGDTSEFSATVVASGTVSISIADVSIVEGDSGSAAALFTVSLSAPSGQTVTVAYATVAGTATSGSDFTATSGTLSFSAGQTTRTISVFVRGDLLNEPAETFFLRLSNPTNAILAVDQAMGTIVDDDAAPGISIADVSVVETDTGTRSLSFSVKLSAASGRPVSVRYATADGSAVAGSDYTTRSGTLSIPAGQTTVSVGIPIIGDLVVEPDESFFVDLFDPTHAVLVTPRAVGRILDNDAKLSINDIVMSEGDVGVVDAVFTVSLSAPSPAEISVSYVAAATTARAGVDFAAVSGTLTIPAGSTSALLRIPVRGDLLDELDETFRVTLSKPVNAVIAKSIGTATIQDDDDPPTISIDDAAIVEGNSGSRSALLTVRLSAPSGLSVAIPFSTANGSATAGSDYTARTGTVTIPAGATSATISLTVQGDTIGEPNETVLVNLGSPTYATLADAQAILTIINDDPLPALSVNDPVIVEGHSGTKNVQFIVSLSAAASVPVTVDFATSDITATAGSDYTARTGTLTIPAGSTAVSLVVALLTDTAQEPDETFQVELSNPIGAILAKPIGVARITNDDTAVSVLPAISAEAASSIFFEVQLSGGPVPFPVTVGYTTANGSGGTAGRDFLATQGVLTIPAGEPRGWIEVPLLDDVLDEANETFTVRLSSPVNARLGTATAFGTILDDDTPPSVTISDAATVERNTGSTALSFTVRLSAPSGLAISIPYSTASGTATAGVDFTSVSGTVTIAAGATVATINVPIRGDRTIEADETFTVNLGTPTYATLEDGVAVGTIVNDDLAALRLARSLRPRRGVGGVRLDSTVMLGQLVDAAIDRWRLVGLDEATLSRLRSVNVRVRSLPGSMLGAASLHTIWIDTDAAGQGWFIDPSPGRDQEFRRRSLRRRPAGVDLLSVLTHELGHAAGLDHAPHGVMAPRLRPGVRWLPKPSDLAESPAWSRPVLSRSPGRS
jgi:parallel beta-helix repeat protein